MKTPAIYWISQLQKWDVCAKHPVLGYVAARPESFYGLCLKQRFIAAYLVFTGKADVVKWYE